MSSIARHKKPGGFENLVNFLETTPKEKREKLVDALAQEDAEFMNRVSQSILNFEELEAVREDILMEVTYELGEKMQVLALALYKLENQKFVEKFTRCLAPKQMAFYKEAVGGLNQVTKSQREGAQLKLVEIMRKIDSARGLNIKPYLK